MAAAPIRSSDRRICLRGDQVLQVLARRKTHLRLRVDPQPTHRIERMAEDEWTDGDGVTPGRWFGCPYGQRGGRLWLAEKWAVVPATAYRASIGVHQTIDPAQPSEAAIYRAGWDRSASGIHWRSSTQMPRWASRASIEIVDVRVERLNEISEEDARSEGVERYLDGWRDYQSPGYGCGNARGSFASLWSSLYGRGSWDLNPWVWVINFQLVLP